MRGTLVVSQIALSVVLLVGASLLVESLRSLARVDVGFDPDGLVVADMTFASARYPERADYLPRFDATLAALEAIPGVRTVSSIRRFPFRGVGERLAWTLPGAPEDVEGTPANIVQVSPGLFETMGVSVIEGIDFAPDGADGRPVAIVSRTLARQAFGDGPAVGRSIAIGYAEIEVLGVVDDIRQSDLRGPPIGLIYIPNWLNPRRAAAFVIRMEPGVEPALGAVRAAVRGADPDQPITELALATDIVAEQLTQTRFFTLLLAVFATLAVALCSVGVYGVVAFGVSRRRREVGIRLALGAEPDRVRTLVVGQGMRPVLAGIVLGALVTLVATRALESLLFGVARFEPLAYGGAALVLGLIGLVACWLPARRAAGGRAIEALTSE
jgi:predicted permease